MMRTLSLVPLLLVMAASPAAAQQGSPEPRAISIGQRVVSQLDASDPKLEDNSYHEIWSFQARAGQLLIISMGSDDFDTFLSLGRMVDGQFREITSNDDSLQSTDSSIEIRVKQDGTYVIRSNSFGEGESGQYSLLVFEAP